MNIYLRMALCLTVALQHISLLILPFSPLLVVFCSNVLTMTTVIHLLHRRSSMVFGEMLQANAPCKGYGATDHPMPVTYADGGKKNVKYGKIFEEPINKSLRTQ